MTGKGQHRWALLAVVLGYALVALAMTDLDRGLAYDEAIYLSQAYPGPALPFTAPRARGLPLLLTPLGWFDAPVPVIRGYLLTLETGLMYLGFNAWLPVLRGRAVIAAGIFGIGWLPLFYGTEAFPNLPVAFGAVAATGYLARYLSGVSGRRALLACSAAFALIALIRPTEAIFVTVGLCAVAAVRPGRELLLRWGLPVLGLVVGCLPWLIEAHLRFGGPLQRFRAASENVGGGLHPENIREQLVLTDGPVSGPAREGIPRLGALWWLLILVAVAVLMVRVMIGRADRIQQAGAVAAVVGVTTATQYLLLTQVQEARFLLPSYANLAVTLAAAAPSASVIRDPARRIGRLLPALAILTSLAAFSVFAGWQIDTVGRVEAQQVAARRLAEHLTDAVRQRVEPPCVVAGEVAFPVIAFQAGCWGAPFRPDSSDITVEIGSDRSTMPRVCVLTSTNPTRTGVHPLPGSVRELASDGAPGWWLFIATPNEVMGAR
ncbi:MAG TPA: hypothetical protein VLL08_11730 [Kineosporiaceae bacterium]|nr:hypothetical protein [Kineosporiaceae bacterium]